MRGNDAQKFSLILLLQNSTGFFIVAGIAFAGIVLLSFLLSSTPSKTIYYFFLGPLQNTYSFGNMINSAIPLMFGGLGVSLAMKANCFNLGGEGQIYSGALVATLSALLFAPLGIFGAILALFLGGLTGGGLAGLSGYLKMKWNTTELITTFLLSNATVLVVSYLIASPFVDPATDLIATKKIPESFQLTKILLPSNLSIGLFLAVLVAIIVWFYLYRTKSGYELRICGLNKRFAQYGGINTKLYVVLPLFLSGFLYGLGGGISIFGTYYSCIKEFSSGMGWNGLAVALIARQNPFMVIPAAVFFAYIESGARNAMLHSDVTFEIAAIVQSLIFFLITSEVLQRQR